MKRIISIAMLLLMAFAVFFQTIAYAEDAVNRSGKIVSIMYDDSGSMSGDQWAYANYSMQALVAMLNPEDTLYITYMSDMTNSYEIDLSNPSKAINEIRERQDSGSTPYKALETAFNTLSSVSNSGPNSQYWLVAFTDGGFNEVNNKKDVTDRLDKYANTTMPNGTKPQIYFMTINDTNDTYTPEEKSSNVDVQKALTPNDVMQNIFDISSAISGRYAVDKKDITLVDGKTISVNVDIPLFNIGVIVQDTDVKVKSVKGDEGVDVTIKSSVDIKAPDSSHPGVEGASSDALKLKGNVTLAGETKNMPAGKYTISFSDDIALENIVVLLEPAIELRLSLMKDGKPVDENYAVAVNEAGLSAQAALYEFGTDNEVLSSLLPKGVKYSIVHTENDTEITSDTSLKLDDLKITSGTSVITASASFPGYFNLVDVITFDATGVNISSVTAELLPDGSERQKDKDGNKDGDDVVYLTLLKDNKTGIKFTVNEDGAPIDKNKAESIKEDFIKGLSVDFNNYEVEVLKDGSYLVYPTKKSFFYNSIIYWLFNHGTQTVAYDANNVTASQSLDFKLGKDFVPALIGILLPIYLTWWILFKKRFPKRMIIAYIGTIPYGRNSPEYRESSYVDLKWIRSIAYPASPLLLLPLRFLLYISPFPTFVKFQGYKFIGQKSLVRRHNTSLIIKGVKNKAISETSMEPTQVSNENTYIVDGKLYIRESITSYTLFKIND